jgi:hypothetical protein
MKHRANVDYVEGHAINEIVKYLILHYTYPN